MRGPCRLGLQWTEASAREGAGGEGGEGRQCRSLSTVDQYTVLCAAAMQGMPVHATAKTQPASSALPPQHATSAHPTLRRSISLSARSAAAAPARSEPDSTTSALTAALTQPGLPSLHSCPSWSMTCGGRGGGRGRQAGTCAGGRGWWSQVEKPALHQHHVPSRQSPHFHPHHTHSAHAPAHRLRHLALGRAAVR